ncbi:Hypothetical protein GbCGDNIH6_8317 [Granulibacter bethesdensis]|nr:Hypothetical protein GbCGDNIH6_8317 [Granulibacter bethesdensis]
MADRVGTNYPRIRGGTPPDAPKPGLVRGLSPHTRGNPHRIPGSIRPTGTIPAYAGEP